MTLIINLLKGKRAIHSNYMNLKKVTPIILVDWLLVKGEKKIAVLLGLKVSFNMVEHKDKASVLRVEKCQHYFYAHISLRLLAEAAVASAFITLL